MKVTASALVGSCIIDDADTLLQLCSALAILAPRPLRLGLALIQGKRDLCRPVEAVPSLSGRRPPSTDTTTCCNSTYQALCIRLLQCFCWETTCCLWFLIYQLSTKAIFPLERKEREAGSFLTHKTPETIRIYWQLSWMLFKNQQKIGKT